MAPDTWTEKYRLHIEDIDVQHERLAGLMATLHSAVLSKRPRLIERGFAHLIEYVELHFADEEQFMARNHYPGLAEHAALHHEFASHCVQLRRDYLDGRIVLTPLMCDLMMRWLENHVETHDRTYCDYYAPVI